MTKRDKIYRVRASVYPTRHANAVHTWVSSGRGPLYNRFKSLNFINLSLFTFNANSFSGAPDFSAGVDFDDDFIVNYAGIGLKAGRMGR